MHDVAGQPSLAHAVGAHGGPVRKPTNETQNYCLKRVACADGATPDPRRPVGPTRRAATDGSPGRLRLALGKREEKSKYQLDREGVLPLLCYDLPSLPLLIAQSGASSTLAAVSPYIWNLP